MSISFVTVDEVHPVSFRVSFKLFNLISGAPKNNFHESEGKMRKKKDKDGTGERSKFGSCETRTKSFF